MLDWSKIKTVLLDMDGTILDLHYDNHFWMEHLPLRYSEMANISFEHAKQKLNDHYERVQGTIAWYCLDYWAEQTQLPIIELKKEVAHLISLREDAKAFLLALKQTGREIVLVTNAHPQSLSLKIEKTRLDQYFDTLYSTHEFGVTKESQMLWHKLQQQHGFNKEHCLFVDDSPTILASAQRYGIGQILAVANPDSRKAPQLIKDFNAITDFNTLIPELTKATVL